MSCCKQSAGQPLWSDPGAQRRLYIETRISASVIELVQAIGHDDPFLAVHLVVPEIITIGVV